MAGGISNVSVRRRVQGSSVCCGGGCGYELKSFLDQTVHIYLLKTRFCFKLFFVFSTLDCRKMDFSKMDFGYELRSVLDQNCEHAFASYNALFFYIGFSWNKNWIVQNWISQIE